MPDLNAWLSSAPSDIPTSTKATLAWRRILQKPDQITIRRSGVALAAQTVRIEQNLRVREDNDPLVTVGVSICVVFGVKDHPDPDVPDTDLRPRDRFLVNGSEYEVVTLIDHEGEIQAVCEARFRSA